MQQRKENRVAVEWHVKWGGVWIDSMYSKLRRSDLKKELIEHDGYPPGIILTILKPQDLLWTPEKLTNYLGHSNVKTEEATA